MQGQATEAIKDFIWNL